MKNAFAVPAIASLSLMVHARTDLQPQQPKNVTIAFLPEGSSSDCAGSADAISFSTGMVPVSGICFNLDELFAPNNTLNSTGYYNYTGNLWAVPGPISYTLENSEAFDVATNYSRIWYRQTNMTGNGESGSGDAAIALNIYPGRDCTIDRPGGRDAPPSTPIWPFYGWTCQSAEDGQCRTTGHTIKSIMVNDASGINARDWQDKCWDFAEQGGTNGLETASVWLLLLGLAATLMIVA
ncbi:hypothetical protein CKM354_001278200 [Cercospora kikuchii]|uniref:Uncharacterized protein n=1 Tax=Cercospora kikuchii TaxID=84275 RepID=A0A9P3FMU1_9PEZI|nr:uncharacterized protein CKM354_001278200 [Cercospora kikuchii]GIZ49755.1 hypothetical protein CKM354_001278200 [Cercospora kikuchii]